MHSIILEPHHPFSLQNIPFGVVEHNERIYVASRILDLVVDLSKVAELGGFEKCSFNEIAHDIFRSESLNKFMKLGKKAWSECRLAIQTFILDSDKISKDDFENTFIQVSLVKHRLPFEIGDYTDFYASKEHATNVGTMFRGKDNALMPNWTHMPIGYHGRASSIVVSETPIVRPCGQIKKDPTSEPIYSQSLKLDYELEIGFVIGVGNELGKPIQIESADDHIFGIVLLNDWSARDIQSWEYVPLGPFLGKNFCTTISPWIITLEALKPFIVPSPEKIHPVLPYLTESSPSAYDINLIASIKTHSCEDVLTTTNLRYMYWSFRQQLAHHTSNGCNMRTGDLCGTGTISGSTPESFGSLLELSWNGKNPIKLSDGTSRSFLQDGDEIVLSGFCKNSEFTVGLGTCSGRILPASN